MLLLIGLYVRFAPVQRHSSCELCIINMIGFSICESKTQLELSTTDVISS